MLNVIMGCGSFGAEPSVAFKSFLFCPREEVVFESYRHGQEQVKTINGPIPGVCGADISSCLSLLSAIGEMAVKPPGR